MTTEKQMEKGISEIVGVFTDSIIVFPGGLGRHSSRVAKDLYYLGEASDEYEGTQR